MKLILLAATALLTLAFAPRAQAQAPTTYSVIRLSAAIPSSFQASSLLGKYTFTTKALINMAQNLDVNTPVPSNIILGYAGDFDDFGHNTPNPNGPAQLVIFNTDSQTKVKTIAVLSPRVVAENKVFNRFKRVAVGTLTLQDTSAGASVGAFTGGTLQVGGAGTRRPNLLGPATTDTLRVSAVMTVVGTINGYYTRAGTLTNGPFLVTKGTLKANSKIVGMFTE